MSLPKISDCLVVRDRRENLAEVGLDFPILPATSSYFLV